MKEQTEKLRSINVTMSLIDIVPCTEALTSGVVQVKKWLWPFIWANMKRNCITRYGDWTNES